VNATQPESSVARSEESGASSHRSRRQIWTLLERLGLPLTLILVTAYFSLSPKSADTFATIDNFRAIVGNNSVLAVVALGLIIPLIAGQFDLSIGAVLGFSAMVTAAALANHNAPVWVAIIVGIAAGAGVGLVNGLLVTVIGINSLVATIGTSTVIGGLVLAYTQGQTILTQSWLTTLGTGQRAGIPYVLFVLIGVACVVSYLLAYTPIGRYLHAVGSNASATRLVGINVQRVILLSFVLSGALAGIAGVLQVARSSSASPPIGPTFLLPAFAAAFLGATMSRSGGFNVLGTIVAVFFTAVSVSGLVLSGAQPWVEPVFQGTALLVAVSVTALVGRRRAQVER